MGCSQASPVAPSDVTRSGPSLVVQAATRPTRAALPARGSCSTTCGASRRPAPAGTGPACGPTSPSRACATPCLWPPCPRPPPPRQALEDFRGFFASCFVALAKAPVIWLCCHFFWRCPDSGRHITWRQLPRQAWPGFSLPSHCLLPKPGLARACCSCLSGPVAGALLAGLVPGALWLDVEIDAQAEACARAGSQGLVCGSQEVLLAECEVWVWPPCMTDSACSHRVSKYRS